MTLHENTSEEEICIICFDTIDNTNKWHCDGCNKNVAHKTPCIDEWFKRKKECPYCKKIYNEVNDNDIENNSQQQIQIDIYQNYLAYPVALIILGYLFIGLSYPYQNYLAYIGIALCDIGLFSIIYICYYHR
tara:strand:- start:1723 stop:2118 length:396 start_codon:yes stop_codon:yes gene_type:complete